MRDLHQRLGSLVALSGLATVAGLATQLLVAFYFGTSQALDAYWLALTVVTALGFYVHPLRESLIAVVFRAAKSHPDRASEVLSAGVVLLLAVAATTAVLLFLGIHLNVLYSGNSAESTFHQILIALLPFIFLFALSETFNAVLLSLDLALHQAWARLLSALAAVASLGLLGGSLGIFAMVVSVLAGQVIVLVVSWKTLRTRGLRWRFTGLQPLRDRAFLLMFGSLLLNYVLAQSYVFLERWTMSALEPGALSAFQYATLLVNVLISLLALPLSNLLWPKFLELEAAHNPAGMVPLAWQTGAPAMFMLLALSAFTWHAASPVISWLFERGNFGATSHQQTVAALRMTILAAVPIALVTLALRALMSQGRSREVAGVGAVMAVLGMGILGLASAMGSLPLAQAHWAVANSCGAALAWFLLQRGSPLPSGLARRMLRGVSCSVAIVLVPLLVLSLVPYRPRPWWELTLWLAGTATLYAGTVLALGLLFGVISWPRLGKVLRTR